MNGQLVPYSFALYQLHLPLVFDEGLNSDEISLCRDVNPFSPTSLLTTYVTHIQGLPSTNLPRRGPPLPSYL